MSRAIQLARLGWEVLQREHSVEAVWTPSGGTAREVRVIEVRQQDVLAALALRVPGASHLAWMDSHYGTPQQGDRLTLGQDSWYVLAVRKLDGDAHELTLGKQPVMGQYL